MIRNRTAKSKAALMSILRTTGPFLLLGAALAAAPVTAMALLTPVTLLMTRKTLMTVKLLVIVDDSDAADDKKDVDCWRSHLDSSAAPPM